MKILTLNWLLTGLLTVSTLALFSCKKTESGEAAPQAGAKPAAERNDPTRLLTNERVSTSSPYVFSLDTIINNGDGTWTWNYSAYNPNPGDGSSGTQPDLDYWNTTLGSYASNADLVSTAVSTDGITWTTTARPAYSIDTGQSCSADTVIQLNLGTRGNLRSYYSITVSKNFSVDDSIRAVYVADNGRSCGVFRMSGFGAPVLESDDCSYGPGRFFTKPEFVWSSTVTVGGFDYTQAEAQAIYETSNRGGIRDAKYGFILAVVVKFSSTTISQTSPVWDDLLIIEDYLSRTGKLSPEHLPTGNDDARSAAERISRWMDTHLCSGLDD